MPVIKIEPIELKTQSGHIAIITGIDPIRSSPLCGYVNLPTGDQHQSRWGLKGVASDSHLSLTNEAMQSWEFETLVEAAIHLMPPRVRNSAGFA